MIDVSGLEDAIESLTELKQSMERTNEQRGEEITECLVKIVFRQGRDLDGTTLTPLGIRKILSTFPLQWRTRWYE